jgi:hypothetical protein
MTRQSNAWRQQEAKYTPACFLLPEWSMGAEKAK